MKRTSDGDGPNATSSVIRKVITTLIIGGSTYLITDMVSEEDVFWAVLLSVYTGGVSLVVQYLAEFDKRLHAVELNQDRQFEQVDDLIRNRFDSISEATELFGRVENSPLRIDLIKQLVRHSSSLDGTTEQIVNRFADSEISRVSEFVKGLSEWGELTYDGEDRDWLLALTRSAQETIDATSFMSVDASGQTFEEGLWTSDLGQRYLEAQQKALERRVTIRRIFMLDDADGAYDPELLRLCELQQRLGINVRLLDPITLPGPHLAWMFDFIVFDSAVTYETTPAAWAKKGKKPSIVSTRLVLNPRRVAERRRGFEDLWAAAQEPGLNNRPGLPPSTGVAD